MAVRYLEMRDVERLRELFRSFPYKEAQQRAQGLDAEALADFFTEAERKRLENPTSPNYRWVAVDSSDAPVALAGLQGDTWHSRFYMLRFGRIAPLLAHRANYAHRRELVQTLLDAAHDQGFSHLSARIDGSEYELLHLLQEMGFYLVDCSMKLSAPLARVPALAPPSGAASMRIREYQADDLAAIQEIASSSHQINHFYNDPYLGRGQTDALFKGWVKRCCEELSELVFVVEQRGRPCGFVIYLNPSTFNKALRTRLVILDFVCMSRGVQGGGTGRWFISQTLQRLAKTYSHVELRTSQNNYPALGCYEGLGLRTVSTDFLLHRHTS